MSGWPRWSLEGEPLGLAKYVLPDEISKLVSLPGGDGGGAVDRLEAVYRALADVGVLYAHQAPSDDAGRQVIRDPLQVLWAPKHATCLDLALVIAGACQVAGLEPAVFLLDPADPVSQQVGHALVGVWIDEKPEAVTGLGPVWSAAPDWLAANVQTALDAAPRPMVVLDPVGIARGLPATAATGLAVDFAAAVAAGARMLTSPDWTWRVAVDIAAAWRRQDTLTCGERPMVPPLRAPYLSPDEAPSPLSLVRADYAQVPFQNRHELTVLHQWCLDVAAGKATGVAVLHGVGGSGKTRLALEAAARLRSLGWYAGLLPEAPREATADRQRELRWLGTVASPTLVVVDYADARVHDVKALLHAAGPRPGPPAAILLTARTSRGSDVGDEAVGDWYIELRTHARHNGMQLAELDIPLPSQHPQAAALAERAARAFAVGAARDTPVGPGDRRQWTTLDHILLGWLAARHGDDLPTTRSALYGQILEHEQTYWATAFTAYTGLPKAPLKHMRQAAAVVALRTPTAEELGQVLRTIPDLADDGRRRNDIADTLAVCLYQGPGEHPALRPDPVADHLTMAVLAAWPALLTHCLAGPDGRGLDDRNLEQALVNLDRAAEADPDSGTALLTAWLAANPDRWPVVLAAAAAKGGPALGSLTRLVENSPSRLPLDQLSERIPLRPVGLARLGLLVDMSRLNALRGQEDVNPAFLGGLLDRASLRQSAQGDVAGAVATSTEAVAIYRKLAAADPAAFLADLAHVLNDLSNHQGAVNDRTGALETIAEVVELCRELAAVDPTAHLPGLAMALNNQAHCQSRVGRDADALMTATDAVQIYQDLAAVKPAAHLPGLAMALYNQANGHGTAGDPVSALKTVTRAVEIRRGLAAADPAAYSSALASALQSQARFQGATGDRAGAMKTITEAVDIYQRLDALNPVAFLDDLAGALNDQSNHRSENGDAVSALTTIDKAVEIYRDLAAADPAVHLPDLAMALNNQSNRQRDTGDRVAAAATITEAVEICRRLASTSPAAYGFELAMALNNQSGRQRDAENYVSALASIEEAVEIYRELAAANRAAHLPELAMALNDQSDRQGDVGDHAGALTTLNEALELYRELAAGNAAAHLPHLAMALTNQARCQRATGDHRGALRTFTEVVQIRRGLAEGNPPAHLSALAEALNNLSNIQRAAGDRAGALTTITEAVQIFQKLVVDNPGGNLPKLATALSNQSNCQSAVGLSTSALATINEAVRLYHDLVASDRVAYLPSLATTLTNQSVCQSNTGDRAGALRTITEAVGIRRDLAAANPAVHLAGLASSLDSQAIQQDDVGDHVDALAASAEAVEIYRRLTADNPAAHLAGLACALDTQSICQNNTANPDSALTTITEAVEIYRRLAADNPAAHLTELAAALNNQASCRSATGDRAGALTSITEAVQIFQKLAVGHPAVYLHHLATMLHNLTQLADMSRAREAWLAAIEELSEPLSRAELRAHFTRFLADTGDAEQILEHLCAASADAQAGPLDELSRTRQTIRAAALTLGISDPALPHWAAQAIPDSHVDLTIGWKGCHDWPAAEAFLHTHSEVLKKPEFRASLAALSGLHPGDRGLSILGGLLDGSAEPGLDAVTAAGRRLHHHQGLLDTWFASPTLHDSAGYLVDHQEALLSPSVRTLLNASRHPEAGHHLAIVELAEAWGAERTAMLITDPNVATDDALSAIDTADARILHLILGAAPGMTDTPATELLIKTVLALLNDDPDSASGLVQKIIDVAEKVELQAHAIHLRNFGNAKPDPIALHLADLIQASRKARGCDEDRADGRGPSNQLSRCIGPEAP